MSTLYDNLLTLCQAHGITGAKMCRDIGVGKSLMTSLKSGRTSSINSATAQKIADYFKIPVDCLLNEEITHSSIHDCKLLDIDLHLFGETKKEPTVNDDGLKNAGYDRLTPENQKMIDALIEKLLKSQSDA